MNRAYTIILLLPWIPFTVILYSFSAPENLCYKIYSILFFPAGMFFSLYLYYYFSKIEEAEESAEYGKFITVRFFNKKRFIVSLTVSLFLLIAVVILYFTTGFDIVTDLLDEDEFIGIAVISLFLLLLYILKYFAVIIYRFLK